MKKYWRLFIILLTVGFLASCNDDDDDPQATTNLENAEIGFDASQPPITIPSGLASSSDPQAAAINGYLQSVNSLSTWLSVFEAPAGATKSTTPIGRKSGRNGRVEDDVVVYTWSGNDGVGNTYTYAYQVTDGGSKYIFEIFLGFNEGPLNKIIYAEESKDDLRNGFMEIFTANLLSEDISDDTYLFKFEWSEDALGAFEFKYILAVDSFSIVTEVLVSPDGSGALTYFIDGDKTYEATWNAAGTSGTYVLYDSDGNILDSGIWPS